VSRTSGRSAGGMCDRPGSRLPLRASVAGLGRGISWRPPAYSLFYMFLGMLIPFGAFRRRGLNPIKLNRSSAGWSAQFKTASAFNQLGQFSSHGFRANCYAQLAVFTARRYAYKRGFCCRPVSIFLCVCPSRSCIVSDD